MIAGRFELHGEIFVTLEAAADTYCVEASWVEEVYAMGALGAGERIGDIVVIADADLDRLASILRWHRHYGVDLVAVVAFLHDRSDRSER